MAFSKKVSIKGEGDSPGMLKKEDKVLSLFPVAQGTKEQLSNS